MVLVAASVSTFAVAGETAAKPTHVVELFTSQGCSSCPPANRFATKLAEDPNMLVLSYGVTYWDYLGWTDTFGDPEFTKRQKDYRDAFGAANVYTPQLVLGGSAHSPRYSKKDVAGMALPTQGVGLRTYVDGNSICFAASPTSTVKADIVTFTKGEQEVDVKRGENGGRKLRLTNVVTAVSEWNLDVVHKEACITPEQGKGYAALIHDASSAKILDAVVINN
jgi:hypothetical protein